MNNTKPPSVWMQALRTAWAQRSARERRALLVGGALLALLLLWKGAIAPAWSVLRDAPVQQARIDAQTRQMLQLQAQTQNLPPATRLSRREALAQLQTASDQWLGAGAQLQTQGEQVLVMLKATSVSGLAQWLALARSQARSQPLQVQLERTDATGTDGPQVHWQGTLLMRLP